MLIDVLLVLVPLIGFYAFFKANPTLRPLQSISDNPDKPRISVFRRLYPATRIRHAGLMPDNMQLLYWGSKLLAPLVIVLALMELIGELLMPQSVFAAAAVFMLPDLLIWQRAQNRKQQIEDSLSFYLDQLIAFLHCGSSLDQAIKQATESGLPQNSSLRQELSLMEREIASGRSREATFQLLDQRTGVRELQSLIMVINNAFLMGGAITDTLKHHAELLRLRQKERGTKRINRKLVVSMAPLVLANFPMFLLLVFFTPLLEMSRMFPQFGF